MNTDKDEYKCPFCYIWLLKSGFSNHQMSHWNDATVSRVPATLEELEARFSPLALWEER